MKKTMSILILGITLTIHADLQKKPPCARNSLRDALLLGIGFGGGILLNRMGQKKESFPNPPEPPEEKKPEEPKVIPKEEAETKKQRRKTLRQSHPIPNEGSEVIQTMLAIFENGTEEVDKSIEILSNLANEKDDLDLKGFIVEIKGIVEANFQKQGLLFMRILAHVKKTHVKKDLERVKGSEAARKRLSRVFLSPPPTS